MKHIETFLLFLTLLVISTVLILLSSHEKINAQSEQNTVKAADVMHFIESSVQFDNLAQSCTALKVTEKNLHGKPIYFAEITADPEQGKALYAIEQTKEDVTNLLPILPASNDVFSYWFVSLTQGEFLALRIEDTNGGELHLLPVIKNHVSRKAVYTVLLPKKKCTIDDEVCMGKYETIFTDENDDGNTDIVFTRTDEYKCPFSTSEAIASCVDRRFVMLFHKELNTFLFSGEDSVAVSAEDYSY